MKRFKTLIQGIGCLLFLFQTGGSAAAPTSGTYPSYVVLEKIAGVSQPLLSLDGEWLFRYASNGQWASIHVPGEAAMQGFAIKHDKPYTYRKEIIVPSDFEGKKVVLRFDGVYSQARLKINDSFVREHFGGFTRWETDITPWVKTGKKNRIELEITDRLDEISYASGYAHHPIGGILRSVSLLAQPQACLTDFYVETRLDSLYRDAVLKIGYALPGPADGEVSFTLTDPAGKPVPLLRQTFPLRSSSAAVQTCSLPVSQPLKWDAEHPNLYTLAVTVSQKGKEISRFSHQIGFRDLRVIQDKLFVNGQSVKLRGACRHDLHPIWGRSSTPELDSLDVLRFKESNMNFVRTSHYPPTEAFATYCDRMGIYVECETAVCFVNTHRQKNYAPGATQDDPAFTSRYVSQCQEMVCTFRSHPSVLCWSIGNESQYGANFRACLNWIKETDPTRPVIFSYPGLVDKKEKVYDLLSMHYQDVDGNLEQWGMQVHGFQGHGLPALFDEWAHPACYTYQTLQEDPNIREFWGISLDKMWTALFEAPGGLGGAIWGYVDETFMLPQPKAGQPFWKEFARTAKPEAYQGNCVGYGEWGIVDVWRRPKPEFWSTKKAYSPVRLLRTQVEDFTSGEQVLLPVHNRFDHTILNEIKAFYIYQGNKKEFPLPWLQPHTKGVLSLPAESWKPGEQLLIRFETPDGALLDAEQVTLGDEIISFPCPQAAAPLQVEETEACLLVKGDHFEIPFDKKSGLISQAVSDGQVVIDKGPYLHLDINLNHLTGAEVRQKASQFITAESDWVKQEFSYTADEHRVVVSVSGTYQQVQAEIRMLISSTGQIDMYYRTEGAPNGYVRETGLAFNLPESVNRMDWKRKGHWSYYEPGAFAGNEGNAPLYESRQVGYGEKPVQEWAFDTHEYYYWADAGTHCRQPLTRMAKGMKENIYYYTLSTGKNDFSVVSEKASVACRLNKRADEQLVLYVNTRWDYPEIAWGNYCKTLEAIPCFGKITLQF